jgi:hypothetical protein
MLNKRLVIQYTYSGDQCKSAKKSKERITVLVSANMSGTEKLPLLVVGKSQRPRCFKNTVPPVESKHSSTCLSKLKQ